MAGRYPEPSAEDIAIANAIIARVTVGKKGVPHFAAGDFTTGGHLSKKYTGWRPDSPCTGCRRKLFDRLRTLVGMTYARTPLDEGRTQARKDICHACPAYHDHTGSCGRLALDAISSKAVNIDGVDVYPCGCLIALKSLFKSEQCPGNFWPK